MIGEVRIVDDVPSAFADLVATAIRGSRTSRFILGCSGGSSGIACFKRLAKADLLWPALELVFADERCVPEDAQDNNAHAIGLALGDRLHELASFHPMSCHEGSDRYSSLLDALGRIDLLQLGLGPDGHTASIFPNSEEFLAPSQTLVSCNVDPSGRNPHDRLTLTRNGLALALKTVVTVIGAEKHDAFAALQNGKPLPGALADGPSTVWLVERTVVTA
jgi:6-phosphogluconolactonase